ncbi:putative chromatin regulator PHD family [Helianthus annuus]|nr:putative chromatin regulator PHD family [Helianthus annuus]
MEQLKHFDHEHLLDLVQFQPDHDSENSDKEDDDEDKDDCVVEELPRDVGRCDLCEEYIYPFHRCYYSCKTCHHYILHKFCAQMPETLQNHPFHPDHNLTLRSYYPSDDWICNICKCDRERYSYECSICKFQIHMVCATINEQKIDHPCHPHQLQRYFGKMISRCNACGNEHSGTFYHCTTCSWFRIHLDCALLPAKLLIQQSTNETFYHSHLLTLVNSFPYIEQKDKFFPCCIVCEKGFGDINIWHYRCDKCRYYAHVDCVTSRNIWMPAGQAKTYKNFKEEDHPNLIRFPFPDESVNLVMQPFFNKGEPSTKREIAGAMFGHPHPLILVDTLLNGSVSLHDPMKKVEVLCDGCVRPIMDVPFYKCAQHHCSFVLHEWCTRLPSEIKHHPDHPKHTIVLLPKVPKNYSDVFYCEVCRLPCNGFAYGCKQCSNFYIDIHCGFIPDVITHEAHPNHLLQRVEASHMFEIKFMSFHKTYRICKACDQFVDRGYHCPTCDIYWDKDCALLLPGKVKHRYDKHPLSLRYYPAENHSSKYFCEICEDELNPTKWFYHCNMCASSMHTACASLKLHCEKPAFFRNNVFRYINVKFGVTREIMDHPHPVTLVRGWIEADGQCMACHRPLDDDFIYMCMQCKFALHRSCVT